MSFLTEITKLTGKLLNFWRKKLLNSKNRLFASINKQTKMSLEVTKILTDTTKTRPLRYFTPLPSFIIHKRANYRA